MKLTPLDIRKQEFEKSLRGYNPEEVETFLDMVATQWEEMEDERRRLENKVQELENQMDHYKRVEEALQEALDQTRRNAEEKLENAKQEAKNIVQEAKTEAQEIKQRAHAKRDQLDAEAKTIENRRNEVVARLRAFLNSELEILEEYQDGDRVEEAPSIPEARTGTSSEEADVSPLDEPEPTSSGGSEPSSSAVERAAEDLAQEADEDEEPVASDESEVWSEQETQSEPDTAVQPEVEDESSSSEVTGEEAEEDDFAEEFAGLQDSLSDVLDEDDEFKEPEPTDEEDSGSDIFEADTLPDMEAELDEADEPEAGAAQPRSEGQSVDDEPADSEGHVTDETDDAGSGSYRSFDDIRSEVSEETAPSESDEDTDAMDDFSDTFDDIDDETEEMDFASAFEEPTDTEPEEPADRGAADSVTEAEGSSVAGPDAASQEGVGDEEEDDLERAMRSLFPVLPNDAEVEGDEDSGSDVAEDISGSPTAEMEAPEEARDEDPSPTESQFEAIKEDVQNRESEQEDKDEKEKQQQKRSRSSGGDEEASTEEIEKIWSILEDME